MEPDICISAMSFICGNRLQLKQLVHTESPLWLGGRNVYDKFSAFTGFTTMAGFMRPLMVMIGIMKVRVTLN